MLPETATDARPRLAQSGLGSATGQVIAHFISPRDRVALIAGSQAQSVRFYVDAHVLVRVLETAATAAVALEIGASYGPILDRLTQVISPERIAIPLLLRGDLRAIASAPVLRALDRAVDVRISLRGFDDLAQCSARLMEPCDDAVARSGIMRHLASTAPAEVMDIAIGAAIAGGRGASVAALAGLCGHSVRRLEERLADAGWVTAKRLLMSVLAAHTQSRVVRFGWSAKRAAVAAGFSSPDVLSRRIERATGMRIGALRRAEEPREHDPCDVVFGSPTPIPTTA